MTRSVIYPARLLADQLSRTRLQPTLAVGISKHAGGSVGPLRQIDNYDLHFITQGVMCYELKHKRLMAPAGHFCLLPRGARFIERNVTRGGRTMSVCFAHFIADSGDSDPFKSLELPAVFRASSSNTASRLFKRLLESVRRWQAGESWGPLQAQRELFHLLTLALQDAAKVGALRFNSSRVGPEWLEAVLEHIENGLGDPTMDVNTLAAVAHLSASHFAHMFRRYAGISPKQLLLRKRMERAEALLISTHLSVKEIASRSGYDDPYHFSAIFKKWTRVSPMHYRNTRSK